MRKKSKNQLREEEQIAREAATLTHLRSRPKAVIPPTALAGFEGMTRHLISNYMNRERMRAEAETIRGNRERSQEAKANQLRAKKALAYIDQQAGS